MGRLCYLCLVFVMLSRLFIAALCSPAGKGLTSWLSFVMFNCVLVTFPCGILGQVWYFMVSIPDLFRLSYFNSNCFHLFVFLCLNKQHVKKRCWIFFCIQRIYMRIYMYISKCKLHQISCQTLLESP